MHLFISITQVSVTILFIFTVWTYVKEFTEGLLGRTQPTEVSSLALIENMAAIAVIGYIAGAVHALDALYHAATGSIFDGFGSLALSIGSTVIAGYFQGAYADVK